MPSGIGYGAAEGLEDVLARLYRDQVLKQREQMAAAQLAEEVRQADMRQRLGEGQLGLGKERLGLDTRELEQRGRQFDTTAGFKERELGMEETQLPVRIRLNTAQASELERKPQAEQEERAFISERDKANYGYDLGKIGAQGANAIATAKIRTRPRIQKVAGVNDQGATVTRFIDIDTGEVLHEEVAPPKYRSPEEIREETLAREGAKKEVKGSGGWVMPLLQQAFGGGGPKTVKMRNHKTGQVGDVPAEKVAAAERDGYTRVQ